MIVHRTLDGGWAECADPACGLLFHVPDMTVTQAQDIPMHVLLPLLEVLDPPVASNGYARSKSWYEGITDNGDLLYHRDYDLPAIMWEDGVMEWWQHGQRHRSGGRPAIASPGGRSDYHFEHGRQVYPPVLQA